MDQTQHPHDPDHPDNGQGPDGGAAHQRPAQPSPPVPPTSPQGWPGTPPASASPSGPATSGPAPSGQSPSPGSTYPPSPYGQSPYGQFPSGAYGPATQQSPYGYGQQPGYMTPSRRPGIIPLTPLALGDLLSGSFAAIRRNAAAVVGTALIVALIEAAVALAATNFFYDLFDAILSAEAAGLDPFDGDPLTNPVFGQAFGGLGLVLAGGLVTSLAQLIVFGVLAVVILRASAGLKTSLGQAWRLTGRQVWTLMALGLVYLAAGLLSGVAFIGVLIALIGAAAAGDAVTAGLMGLLLFVLSVGLSVLWVWLTVKFLLAPAAAAVELKGPWRSLGRSWSLTRGHWWRTFGVVLLVAVIIGVVSSVLTTPLSMVSGLTTPTTDTESMQEMLSAGRLWANISVVVSALVNALALAYLSCLVALVYVDYRIRHESFDLELGAAADRTGLGDDERFSTVQDVQAAAGTDDLVPGRAAGAVPPHHHPGPSHPSGQPGPSGS
jgi:hypothetical protein